VHKTGAQKKNLPKESRSPSGGKKKNWVKHFVQRTHHLGFFGGLGVFVGLLGNGGRVIELSASEGQELCKVAPGDQKEAKKPTVGG